MPRLFRAIVLALLLAPSLGVAQRLDSLVSDSVRSTEATCTSARNRTIRRSSFPRPPFLACRAEWDEGPFLAGAGIGLLGGALLGGLIGSLPNSALTAALLTRPDRRD